MSTHVCIDCDSPGDGNCSACRGSGRIGAVSFTNASGGDGGEISCPSCEGSGLCPKCEGSGEIEIGGEG
jgi:hypothetical protein